MFDKHTFMRILTKELTGKLLAHYEMALEEVKKEIDFQAAKDMCWTHDVAQGICACAKYAFSAKIYTCDIIADACSETRLPKYPDFARTLEELHAALQLRIDILRKILKTEF